MLTVDHKVHRETLLLLLLHTCTRQAACRAGHTLQGMWEVAASLLSLTLAPKGTEQQQMTCAKGKEWELLNEERHVRESQHSLAAAPAHNDTLSACIPGAFYSFVVSVQIARRRERGGQEEKMGGEEKAESGNGFQNVVLGSRIEPVMFFCWCCCIFFPLCLSSKSKIMCNYVSAI